MREPLVFFGGGLALCDGVSGNSGTCAVLQLGWTTKLHQWRQYMYTITLILGSRLCQPFSGQSVLFPTIDYQPLFGRLSRRLASHMAGRLSWLSVCMLVGYLGSAAVG